MAVARSHAAADGGVGDASGNPEESRLSRLLSSSQSLPSIPSSSGFGSHSDMGRRQFDALNRLVHRNIVKEIREQSDREALARRREEVLEFEKRRSQAYARETGRRRTLRNDSHKAVKDRISSKEEKKEQSLTELQDDISVRFDAVARRSASKSQEVQRQWRDKFSRHHDVREQWQRNTSAHDEARARHLQDRWDAKEQMLASRDGEEAKLKEERERDRMKQQASSRAAAEQNKTNAMNALLTQARERALRAEANAAENALKARKQARAAAESNALAAQRRKAQAADQAMRMEDLETALAAKERRMESQLEQLTSRRKEVASENARKQQEHDASLRELRQQQDAKDAARKQHFLQKSQAENERIAAMRKMQDTSIEAHRRANEHMALQRRSHQRRLQKLTRSLSATPLGTRSL